MNRPTHDEWLEKYYPKEACYTTKEEALEHSIRKWEGLLFENLPGDFELPVEIDAETCALCYHYMDDSADIPPTTEEEYVIYLERGCGECPLFKVRGDVRCDNTMEDEISPPYISYFENGNPAPMIDWLKKARQV
jgi:hypothetical protein